MEEISSLLDASQTLQLRQKHVAGACLLHYADKPVKIVRSQAQFLFDEVGQKYLDFVTRITNVGHCHPEIVEAACTQMATAYTMSFNIGLTDNSTEEQFCRHLLATLPDTFDSCFFTNSGAEANDLALQLARNYTGRDGIVVVDGAFHGAVNLLIDISPKCFRKHGPGKKPWVHVIPCPDTYRGSYGLSDPEAGEKFYQEAKVVIDRAINNKAQIGCFISEPVFVVHGVLIPPSGWLQRIYSYIHELGGIVIADEIQCGLGRSGSHFWAFQSQGAVPDIITIGKPLCNGHPIGAVITSAKIANSIRGCKENYKCGAVAAAAGLSVLKVMNAENCLQNAHHIGTVFKDTLTQLQQHHTIIGDVRGLGLMIGVDIVWSYESKKPAPELAEKISYRLKEEGIFVANDGEYRNVLLFLPPLCISLNDIQQAVSVLDRVLKELQLAQSDIFDILEGRPSTSTQPEPVLWNDSDDSEELNRETNYDSMD